MAAKPAGSEISKGAATRFGSATICRSDASRCLWRDGAQRASASVERAGEAADRVSPLACEERGFSSRIDLTGGRTLPCPRDRRGSTIGNPASERRAEDPELRARALPIRYPPTAPTAEPTTAVVHTFRSLLMASSKALNPAHKPTPNPAPAPPIVHVTVARGVRADRL